MTTQYDAIVIGTGQSGPSLAARLAREGLRTAIIERDKFGGTCVNYGCTPTKTLVASARATYMVRRAADFGVMLNGEITVDMQRVKARKDQVVARSRNGLEQWMNSLENLTIYRGHARFETAKRVHVGETLLEAEKIFINVGGRAFIPDLSGLQDVDYLTNSTMLDVDFLPEHLIIVGGSYIGLEFGQMYRRFGSHVTLIEKGDRLVSHEDDDTSQTIQQILANEGIEIRLKAECIAVSKHGEQIAVGLSCDDDRKEVVGSHLLLAVGRRPNTDDLGLGKACIATNPRGYIQVNDQLQTNVPGIWAIGDVNGRGAFTHTSYNDYEIVAANLFDNDPRKVTDRITAYALYVDPPLGRVGLTEQEVRASGRKALIGKMPMTRVGRAHERSETQGFMKVLIDAETKQILGAAILGIGGDEIVHSLLDVMYAGAPYTVIKRAIHIHPTVTELIPTLLSELKLLD